MLDILFPYLLSLHQPSLPRSKLRTGKSAANRAIQKIETVLKTRLCLVLGSGYIRDS